MNLDLTLRYSDYIIFDKERKFDESITYIEEESNEFRKLLLYNDAYLSNDDNYVKVGDKYLPRFTEAMTLRNTKVILYWRGIILTEIKCKKILSLGLAFLLDFISEAQLLFDIKLIIPNGLYEIKIRKESKTYVFIGIEEPVFNI